MHFTLCDDSYYGYNEALHSVYASYEEAKIMVDIFLVTNEEYDGKGGNSFIEIIRMKIGSTKKEILFDTRNT